MGNNDDSDRDDFTVDSSGDVVRHRWEQNRRPTVAIVEAVAVATNRQVTELPNLHETVDADALDSFLTAHETGDLQEDDSIEVSFSYAGVDIVIDNSGMLEVWTGDTAED